MIDFKWHRGSEGVNKVSLCLPFSDDLSIFLHQVPVSLGQTVRSDACPRHVDQAPRALHVHCVQAIGQFQWPFLTHLVASSFAWPLDDDTGNLGLPGVARP